MIYGSKEYSNILTKFKLGQNWLNDIAIEIVGGENELDALTILRAYENEATLDNILSLTAQMVINKEIKFMRNGKEVFHVFYNGGDLSAKFQKMPFLLNVLMKLCYGLMIKKLTPPSEDSENEERQ